MGWSIGYDPAWDRDIGYGVPAFCDYPGCSAEIDRGLAYVCGGGPYGDPNGCGLYFCEVHLRGADQLCERCEAGEEPFPLSAEHPRWIRHKLTNLSWQEWRDANPSEAAALRDRVRGELDKESE